MKKTYLKLLNINDVVDFSEPKYSPEKIKNPRTLELVEVYKLLNAMNCKYEEVFDENCQYKKK